MKKTLYSRLKNLDSLNIPEDKKRAVLSRIFEDYLNNSLFVSSMLNSSSIENNYLEFKKMKYNPFRFFGRKKLRYLEMNQELNELIFVRDASELHYLDFKISSFYD